MDQFFAGAHPFAVHFAVALPVLSALFDCASLITKRVHFATTGLSLAVLAVPFLLVAVFTGNLAETFLEPALKSGILETHKTFANITVWLFVTICLLRVFYTVKKQFTRLRQLLYIVLVLGAAATALYTAERGGEIRHGETVRTLVRQ